MIEKFEYKGKIYLIIIRASFEKEGIHFFTPDEYSQQLAYMKRPEGYQIQPHQHKKVQREVLYTNEVLYIKKGKVRIDLYDEDKEYLESRVVATGDVVLLAFGGHGFFMLEESEIIEAKQGPYAGENDKERFQSVDIESIIIK